MRIIIQIHNKHNQLKVLDKTEKPARLIADSMRKAKSRFNRLSPGLTDEGDYISCKVKYLPYKVKDVWGEMVDVVNEFVAKNKTELFKQLAIFTAKDEVEFVKEYWAG